jgi:hypothetical protein
MLSLRAFQTVRFVAPGNGLIGSTQIVPPAAAISFSVACRSPPRSASWLPQREQTSRFRHSRTVVSGPYRRAISAGEAICDGSVRSFAAGSALVPPTAARSDAVAGSTY